MKKKVIKRGPRIKGICADAEALGVTHQHLWAVLSGRRESASLRRRYQALQRAERGSGHARPRP